MWPGPAVSFLFGGILWAAGAAAAPVVIHLIMRTRPRQMVFPALRFVRKTHQSNISKLKLKHLILLALRMGALAVLAMLLARPFIADWVRSAGQNVPSTAVIVIDNSGSMRYGQRDGSALDRARRTARRIVEMLPEGSRLAVLSASAEGLAPQLISSREQLMAQIEEVAETYSHDALAPALGRALSLLRDPNTPRKELYVLTDMAQEAWRDLAGLRVDPEVGYVVVDLGSAKNANVRLEGVRLGSPFVPEGVDTQVRSRLASSHLGGVYNAHVELDGKGQPAKPVDLPAGGSASVTFTIRPPRPGTLHGRIVLESEDPLSMDNVRYFTLRAGQAARMLAVTDKGENDRSRFLVSKAAAHGSQSWVRSRPAPLSSLSDALDEADLVLLANVAFVSDEQWDALEGFVRRGGRLWVVVGPRTSPTSYATPAAQKLLPLALGPMQELPRPERLEAGDYSHRLLAPFRAGNHIRYFPLREVEATLRFTVDSAAPDAETVVRYADGVPAIVTRSVGRGECLLWNVSPLREHSNLARMVQYALLAQGVVRSASAERTASTSYLWGESVSIPVPRGLGLATAMVQRPGATSPASAPVSPAGTVDLRLDELGPWTVSFTGQNGQAEVGFSVNADPAESDLSRVDPNALIDTFGGDRLLITSDVEEAQRRQLSVSQRLDLLTPLLLALLVLLIGESYFANRFYKRGAVTAMQE